MRTSHYPPVNEYLDLADEYGLYIIDETGDEAHATEYVSNIPDFIPMYQERVRQMADHEIVNDGTTDINEQINKILKAI